MTPAEHRAKAEELLSQAWSADDIARAQAHATLAQAPPPLPREMEPYYTRNEISRRYAEKPQQFSTADGASIELTPARDVSGVILSFGEDGRLLEDPSTVRMIAWLLLHHADRMESKP